MNIVVNHLIKTEQFSRLASRLPSARTISFAGVCVGIFALAPIKNSYATGSIKVESNGFLRKAEDRSDNSSTVFVGPRMDGTGKVIEGKLEADAIVQITDNKNMAIDKSAFTIESANAYVATSKDFWSKHQITVGRRVYDWSQFDDTWQFGTYSPRFIWDPIRPETIGLTGAFYEYKSKHWRVLGYGSALSIPERGYPMRSENGKLVSSNPFGMALPESAIVAKQNLPINYNIDYPPMNDLIFNPGGVVSVRHSSGEDGKGFWAQGLYGYLPVHQADLAVEVNVPAQGSQINADIHPAVLRHHLLTFETGYQASRFSLWGSQSIEKPDDRTIPPDSNWLRNNSGRALISSVGGDVWFLPRWKFASSYIYVNEKEPDVADNAQFSVELPGRFPYRRAMKTWLEYDATDRMSYHLEFTDDFEKESQLVSGDIFYHIVKKDNALTLNLGSDFFASATSKGYIGQYKGNDRFRGGVTYAF